MNEILEARGKIRRIKDQVVRHDGYNDMKRSWTHTITLLARSQRFQPVEYGCFTYLWFEPNRKRDPSNFTAGGRKIVEDALQEAGLLAGDGWKHVLDIRDLWLVSEDAPGLVLFVGEKTLSYEEAVWMNEEWRKR
jgi:hypothetical protein